MKVCNIDIRETDKKFKYIYQIFQSFASQQLIGNEGVSLVINLKSYLNMTGVVGLNSLEGYLELCMNIDLAWTDPHMIWDPSNFSNITYSSFPTDHN